MLNNKLFKGFGALAVLSLIVWGCQSLDENPDFASPSTFYKTEADLKAAVSGTFQSFNKEWFNSSYNRCVFDCALGIQSGYEKGPQYYKTGQYVASDEYIQAYWAQIYDGVNRANVVLASVDGATAASADAKKVLKAQASFLRALYIYHVYIYFENIPVPDKPTRELGEFTGNDGGAKKALDQMKADLELAERDLPNVWTGADLGRPNKWAAKTLLAKVLLERKEYQAAADKAKDVLTNSGLTLFTDFADVFSPNTENMGERLFELQCDFLKDPWGNYNNMHAHFTPTDWDGGDPNALTPGDGVTAAGWADAWIVGDGQFRTDMFDEAKDKRVKVTFMSQYRSKNVGGAVVKYNPKASSPFVAPNSPEREFKNVIYQKWIEYNLGGWQFTKKNYGLLRLSDAYLAHAEAVAFGASGDGLASLNAVRTRAGLDAAASLTRDNVFDEWLREFAGEGWAFPTCRRFGKTADIIKKYAGRTAENNKFRLLPIPLVELTGNKNVKQNAGW